MKYYTSAIVLVALLGADNLEQSQAVKLGFTDDLIKSLTEDMQKEQAEGAENQEQSAAQTEEPKAEEKKPEKKVEKKAEKKPAAKKDDKKAKKDDKKKESKKETKPAKKEKKEEETEIPMDQAAIKAYSSVIADAAEDSEPASPVQYHQTMQDEEKPQKASMDVGIDAMGSMIQNEITTIKDASIKAAKEKDE